MLGAFGFTDWVDWSDSMHSMLCVLFKPAPLCVVVHGVFVSLDGFPVCCLICKHVGCVFYEFWCRVGYRANMCLAVALGSMACIWCFSRSIVLNVLYQISLPITWCRLRYVWCFFTCHLEFPSLENLLCFFFSFQILHSALQNSTLCSYIVQDTAKIEKKYDMNSGSTLSRRFSALKELAAATTLSNMYWWHKLSAATVILYIWLENIAYGWNKYILDVITSYLCTSLLMCDILVDWIFRIFSACSSRGYCFTVYSETTWFSVG